MPLRPSSQCRRTLARTPVPAAPSIWITDRMLFEAFQRYSLSSGRSNVTDTRCVHFNAGPLEHRRRTGKRRMTAVLPGSRLDLPAWILPLAQDNSSPIWSPPTKPSERHKKPGLLTQLITWLEDYPPDEPFIAPPSDEAIGLPAKAGASSTASVRCADTLAEDGVNFPTWRADGALNLRELLANFRHELLSAPEEFKARRAILHRYYDALVPHLTSLVLFQSNERLPGVAERALLRDLLDPFAGHIENTSHTSMALASRVSAHWQARITRAFSDLAQEEPGLQLTWIWTELAKFLCEPRSIQSVPETSDFFYNWCSSLKQLSRGLKDLSLDEQYNLVKNIRIYIAQGSRTSEEELAPAEGVLNAQMGWAIALFWRPTSDMWKQAFDDVYSDLTRDVADSLRDRRTFHLCMSELCLSLSISRDDFTTVYAYRDSPSQWSALFATLANQGARSSRLLQKLYVLLARMDYTDQVADAIRAETNPSLHRCVEGLAVAMGDYRAALQMHEEQTLSSLRPNEKIAQQPWSYRTLSLYVNAMIQDPRIQITETTALVGSLESGSPVHAMRLSKEERQGRAKLLEEMSHTLAYDAPKFRPYRVWKELQVWNQLYRKFTGRFSLKISQIMMDLTVKRLERGEVISTRRLKLMENVVRVQSGEEQAQVFGERLTRWRDQNRYLGTEQQKFPLRFRADLSPAELEQKTEGEATRMEAHSMDALAETMMAARIHDVASKPRRSSSSPSLQQHAMTHRLDGSGASFVTEGLKEGSRFA